MNFIWGIFFAFVLALLALDLFVFHRRAHVIPLREAIGWSIFWIAVGIAFSAVVYVIHSQQLGGMGSGTVAGGLDAATVYLTAYLLEKSLSVDNLFVIALVFISFNIEPMYRHRILYWGILGAIIARCVFIGGGIFLIETFDWIFYVFGAFLVYSGGRMLLSKDDDDGDGAESEEPRSSLAVRIVRRIIPVSMNDHGGKLVTRENGFLVLTRCGLALIAVEAADVVFAVDSIPAVLGVTSDPFIAVSSNIFAIMGLRSLYFVLEGMMDKFRYLDTALATLLIIIGLKLCLHHVVKLPNWLALGLVVGIVGAGILASLWVDRNKPSAK